MWNDELGDEIELDLNFLKVKGAKNLRKFVFQAKRGKTP